ncbi:MAG: hypothetical protein IMZ44_13295 [Planctomycetes bacterium]|nr:hypothetical protein [Planctomycetota bacterium]
MNGFDRLAKARAARGKARQPSAENIDALAQKAGLCRCEAHMEQIRRCLEDMPPTFRRTYLLAVAGKSKAAAIKAFCAECVGWERREVALCTAPACALYAFRPFTGHAADEPPRQDKVGSCRGCSSSSRRTMPTGPAID